MLFYERGFPQSAAAGSEFRYRAWISYAPDGWAVDAVQIWRHGEPLLPKRPLCGAFATEADAVARADQWCGTIIRHLTTADFPAPGTPAQGSEPFFTTQIPPAGGDEDQRLTSGTNDAATA